MSFDFFPNEQSASLLRATRNPSTVPDPGVWGGFASGTGNYAMRSLAEAGRSVDMLGSVFPIAVDAVTGGTARQDQYFQEHDDVFNGAVDHWTPRPGDVGTAGQIAGQLAGGVLQAVISPALLVGSAQLSTGEDLVRQGVDAGAANVAGDVAGLGMAVGLRLPFLGDKLATRVLSGAGGNVAQGAVVAGVTHGVLDAAGNPEQAEQYQALDLKGRLIDAMLGAAFGGLAHVGAPPSKPAVGRDVAAKLTATDEAALLVANQARHMEDATPQGRPATAADATMHVDAMRQAIDQTLRGEAVTVDPITKDMRMVPDETQYQQRMEVTDEAHRLAEQEAPLSPPIFRAPDAQPASADVEALGHDPASVKARQFSTEQPDLMIASNRVDANGAPLMVKASEAIAQADADLAHTQAVAPNIFKTAALCLLGAL